MTPEWSYRYSIAIDGDGVSASRHNLKYMKHACRRKRAAPVLRGDTVPPVADDNGSKTLIDSMGNLCRSEP